MRKFQGLLVLTVIFCSLFTLNFISASCGSGQIDINTATSAELDELSGIGPAKAQSIIDSRPFSSVDDLLRVKGIGNVTLSNIKVQGLACVDKENSVQDGEESTKTTENKSVQQENLSASYTNENIIEQKKPEEKEAIILNPQVIKTENTRGLQKNTAVFGFAVFCVLITVLFIIRGKKYKNEFR